MADSYSRDRYDRDDRYERERYGRDDRGALDRAGDEVRSWFGDDDAARRRQMDERERERWPQQSYGRDDRWRGSAWGDERSYSSDRSYGDRNYGRHGEPEYGWRGMAERDYTGQTWRASSTTPSTTPGYGAGEYGRQSTYAPGATTRYGTSSEQRYGYSGDEHGWSGDRARAREWSSTEGWRVPGPHAGRGPRGYQRSDERIRDEIHERLTAHGLIDATDVECRVVNGEVTLTGFVDSRAAKRAAEDIAEDLYGVREVHNQLRVRSHAGDEGVGRTSVLGLTETQAQANQPQGTTPDSARPRTRT
jgi:osmotically-inducible protein OsmY